MNDSPNILGSVNISSRGTRIAQLAMDTAGGNIANASTPGYGRADLQVLAGGVDQLTQSAFIGRAAAPLAERDVYNAQRDFSFSDARLNFLKAQIAPVLGDMSEENLGRSVSQFFAAWHTLAATPDSLDGRQVILSRAGALCTHLNTVAANLRSQQQQIDGQVGQLLAAATGRLTEVAALNTQILISQASGSSTVDLENRRAQDVCSLVEDLGVEVVTDVDGSTRLLAAGISVVSGSLASSLSTRPDPVTNFHHVVVDPALDSNLDPFVTGGRLGAMLTARDSDLATFAGTLDQFAADLVVAVNAQHQLGFGLDGLGARNFFAPPPAPVAGFAQTIALSPDVAGQPMRVAAAGAVNTLPSDTFNATAIAGLGDQPLASANTQTFTDALISLATQAGLMTQQANQDVSRRRALLESAEAVRDQQIGVDQQQQILRMREAQAQYQAGLKMIDIQFRAIDSLLALVR